MQNKIEKLTKALPLFIIPGLVVYILALVGGACLKSDSNFFYWDGVFCIALSAFTLVSVFYSMIKIIRSHE